MIRSLGLGLLAALVCAAVDAGCFAVWGRFRTERLLETLALVYLAKTVLLPLLTGYLAAPRGGSWLRRAFFGGLTGMVIGLAMMLILLGAATSIDTMTDKARFWQEGGALLASQGVLLYAALLPVFAVFGGVAGSVR